MFQRNPDIHQKFKNAAITGNAEIIDSLLEQGLSPNTRCSAKYDPMPILALAAYHDNIKVVKLLLAAGANFRTTFMGQALDLEVEDDLTAYDLAPRGSESNRLLSDLMNADKSQCLAILTELRKEVLGQRTYPCMQSLDEVKKAPQRTP